MPEATLRLAYFARGLDGLFLPAAAGCEGFGLLRGDSPEERWAGDLVPRERALVFRLRGHAQDPYPATGDVLRDSNIAQLLRRRGIRALLLSSPFTPQVRDWAVQHRIRVLAADYAQQRRLENKLWFDRFLTRHGIPKPESATRGRVVVQRVDSMGGEGTYFLDSAGDWPALAKRLQLPRGERRLVRRFIDGRPLGITVFVAPGLVALSAVRLQCYYPRQDDEKRRLFAGIQWLTSGSLSRPLGQRIDDVFRRLGMLLYRRRYFGFANFDFLADRDDRVFVIECNPRMSAATPQLLARPELSGGLPLGQLFLEACSRVAAWPRRPVVVPLPAADFAGATLDIISLSTAQQPICREFDSGPRRVREGNLSVFSLAAKGQIAQPETTLATIHTDFPLYDSRGRLNAAGRRLVGNIRYT